MYGLCQKCLYIPRKIEYKIFNKELFSLDINMADKDIICSQNKTNIIKKIDINYHFSQKDTIINNNGIIYVIPYIIKDVNIFKYPDRFFCVTSNT